MKVPQSLFVLILLSCLTPIYFYSKREFLNSLPEGGDLQLREHWVCAIWNETRMTSWRPFRDWKPISSSGKPPQTKVKNIFWVASPHQSLLSKVCRHFFKQTDRFFYLETDKTKSVMKFCAQLCKNEKRKTSCLTNCIRSKIRLWVPSQQLFDCLYKVKNKTLGFIKATE